MAADTQRGRQYLERSGILPPWRNPVPRIEPDRFLIHTEPEAKIPPLPLPELLYHLNGDPPPDRGQTLPWPHEVERES